MIRKVKPAAIRRIANFEINVALLEELGERLVSRPEIALAELVKNSYDADASRCEVGISETAISVADDGHGMTEDVFLNNWMVISAQNKSRQRYSRSYRRTMAGSKGVGRFSARYLGREVLLETVAELQNGARQKLVAEFDWDAITSASNIQAVTIPYYIEAVPPETRTGTVLTIRKIRPEAEALALGTLKTDLLKLTDPGAGLEPPPFFAEQSVIAKKDPGFTVSFVGSDNASNSDNLQSEVLRSFVGRIRLELNKEGTVAYEVFWKGFNGPIEKRKFKLADYCEGFTADEALAKEDELGDIRGLKASLASIQQLPVSTELHSPVFIDLRFFPKRKGAFSGLPLDGRLALGWVRENASYGIVDNNFSMAAYAGEESDWLGIDASKSRNERTWQSIFTPAIYPMSAEARSDPAKNPMLALPRNTQLIGRVHISTSKPLTSRSRSSDGWLQPNMDRESLRANGAFRSLWHLARFAAETIAHFDRKLRLEAEREQYRQIQEQARTGLSATINELKDSLTILPQHRQEIVKKLEQVEANLIATERFEKDARLSLELMSMMGVMAGFMTHEFEKAMDTLSRAADNLRLLSKLKPEFADAAEEVIKHEHALANYLDYMRVFIDRARDPVLQSFKARAQISRAIKTLSPVLDGHNIDIEIDIDTKLLGPAVPLAAYNGVIINLISNAVKALVAKAGDDRRVRVYATNDNDTHVLVCADNGIGIPLFLRDRIWDPLFSTTRDNDIENPMASGLGLGLSVVQQVVKKLNGKIQLLDRAPAGFVTAFRLSLPLK
ncbi:sensor histidine kinase [Massilia sp. Leaf139]|uniref:sensor histidine kinase n=1 Tax=Massilia sp. Leaf139 TaxID=1736272 RepID=UPI0009E8CE2F|nr:sensor histidine kinase [Massilia sp. Leaf139]